MNREHSHSRTSLPILLIFLLLAPVLGFSCSMSWAESPDNKPSFKIGFILSETGPWAEYGQAQKIALELARRNRPDLFHRVKFIYEDCQYQAKNAVTAFNKLKNVDKADLIFIWGVEPSHVVAPLAEKAKFPLIVSAIDPSAARGREYVIRTINYAEQYSSVLLKYFRSQHIKRIGIISSELTFHNLLIDGLKKNLQKTETLEVIENLLPHDNDLQTVVTKLRGKSFDVLGLFLNPSQIIQYYRHARAQHIEFPIFGIQTFQSKTLIEATSGRMDGAVFPHNTVKDTFAKSFLEIAGHDIQLPWAANAYDFAMLAGELLSTSSRHFNARELVEKFKTVSPQEGVGGSFESTFEPEVGHFFEYPIVVKKIQGDSFKIVARYVF